MTADAIGDDPYPRMILEYALGALKLRFGTDSVAEEKGRITLKVPYPERQAPAFVTLTLTQAKFLVAHPISVRDLVDDKYPADWPGGPSIRSDIPRPTHRGPEPVKFSPPKE